MRVFALRTLKELLRDKLNLAFGLGFPIVLLLLLTLIQSNIPVQLFELDHLTPGVVVFGLSFLALFSGMLLARDRCESFLLRLFASPLRPKDYILGYLLPIFPLGLGQGIVCFLVAALLGLKLNANVLLCLAVSTPAILLFEGIGMLCGSCLSDRQVGGVCGALLTNLSAWLSGTWFDISMLGKTFERIAKALPFANAVEAGRAALQGDYGSILPHLWVVIAYAVLVLAAAVLLFGRTMKRDAN